MNSELKGKRITFKHARPNPLFQNWLMELYEEAKEKKSKLEPMLQEALVSISKYPLPLQTGAECAILKGFDRRLCLFLDKRLEVYNSSISSEIPQQRSSSNEPTAYTCNSESQTNIIKSPKRLNAHKEQTNRKTYRPSYRSGGYAILIALLEHSKENSNNKGLKKEELIEKAQKHCEESFTRPKPETFYTAWSSMSKLITKGLVKKFRSRKVIYSLTEQGLLLATTLLKESENRPTTNDIIFNGSSSSQTVTINEEAEVNILDEDDIDSISSRINIKEAAQIDQKTNSCEGTTFIKLLAGSFDIILLIDKNETSGVSKKNDPTVAQFNKYPDLKHEYRSLKVGDFTWVARSKLNKDRELVLPYVVERKRMDDLGSSIKDGRFHEQKFRLRKCGLKNVIYMVENYGSNKHVGLPVQSLMQAVANTRVQDGFKVHLTDSLTNSARFLAMMTKRLTYEYKDKDLIGHNQEPTEETLMTFDFFNKSSSKTRTLTVMETFIKLLLQLKGVSVEKALAITETYSTPSSLIKAYKECNKKEGEMLLANLKYGDVSRNVGPSVSKTIYQLFHNKDLM